MKKIWKLDSFRPLKHKSIINEKHSFCIEHLLLGTTNFLSQPIQGNYSRMVNEWFEWMKFEDFYQWW